MENLEREIILLGDMNAWVGNNREGWNGVIGETGEEMLNNNRERLLNFFW